MPDSNLRKNGSEIDRPVRQVQLKPTSLKVAVEKLATFSATATPSDSVAPLQNKDMEEQ